VEEKTSRTPKLSLEDTFLIAVAGLPEEDVRAAVVAEALGHLQHGFDAHYAGGGATDDDVLVGDNSYALAVETIARLDEPRFVAVASRMIRDGAGLIAAGGAVSLRTWIPHLADLLDIISGEGEERSEARIEAAAEELRGLSG
jgi:methylmalonyl-CoA mutase cobalamin-binding subunit